MDPHFVYVYFCREVQRADLIGDFSIATWITKYFVCFPELCWTLASSCDAIKRPAATRTLSIWRKQIWYESIHGLNKTRHSSFDGP